MQMQRARLCATDDRYTLIAVESLQSSHHRSSIGCQCSAQIEPVALVIFGPDGTHAIDMQDNPVSCEMLIEHTEGLADLMTHAKHLN